MKDILFIFVWSLILLAAGAAFELAWASLFGRQPDPANVTRNAVEAAVVLLWLKYRKANRAMKPNEPRLVMWTPSGIPVPSMSGFDREEIWKRYAPIMGRSRAELQNEGYQIRPMPKPRPR